MKQVGVLDAQIRFSLFWKKKKVNSEIPYLMRQPKMYVDCGPPEYAVTADWNGVICN